MANCNDCIHRKVCVILAFPEAFENTEWEKEPCDHFKDADVVPKSEVEQLRLENSILSQNADTAFQDGLNEAQDLYAEQIKTEVAREIFEDLENFRSQLKYYGFGYTALGHKLAELKKKYTEV